MWYRNVTINTEFNFQYTLLDFCCCTAIDRQHLQRPARGPQRRIYSRIHSIPLSSRPESLMKSSSLLSAVGECRASIWFLLITMAAIVTELRVHNAIFLSTRLSTLRGPIPSFVADMLLTWHARNPSWESFSTSVLRRQWLWWSVIHRLPWRWCVFFQSWRRVVTPNDARDSFGKKSDRSIL